MTDLANTMDRSEVVERPRVNAANTLSPKRILRQSLNLRVKMRRALVESLGNLHVPNSPNIRSLPRMIWRSLSNSIAKMAKTSKILVRILGPSRSRAAYLWPMVCPSQTRSKIPRISTKTKMPACMFSSFLSSPSHLLYFLETTLKTVYSGFDQKLRADDCKKALRKVYDQCKSSTHHYYLRKEQN